MLESQPLGVTGSGAGAGTGGIATVSATAHLHKCIYEGSKSYWRTRETVDVRIIEHTDANILEIICFEVESYQDADRLYLNTDKLYKKLETPELKEKVEQKREEYARQRKRVPNEEITRTLVREAATQYVLTRLVTTTTKAPPKIRGQAAGAGAAAGVVGHGATRTGTDVDAGRTDSESSTATTTAATTTTTTASAGALNAQTSAAAGSLSGNNSTTSESSTSSAAATTVDTAASAVELAEPRFAVDLAILTGDRGVPVPHAHGTAPDKDKRLDVFLDGEPEGIEHVVIVRARKKATHKEFNQVLRNLRMDNDMLNKATSDAQRKAGLAVSSVDGFKSFALRKTYDPKTMSMAQWRWIWAGRRVILQNFVAAVRVRLERDSRRAEEATNDEMVQTPQLAGSASQPGVGPKARRMKDSTSMGTKLPSLLNAKQSRHSLSSLRRMTRGSREPREINEFSAAFSSAISAHAESEKAVVKDGRGQRASFATLLPELSLDGKIHNRVV